MKKYTNLQIQKQLKQNKIIFCKSIIYKTQSYNKKKYKIKKRSFKVHDHHLRENFKKYYLRRSTSKKLYDATPEAQPRGHDGA